MNDYKTVAPPVIRIHDLTKVYNLGDHQVHALRGVTFDITKGELVAIMGPSGSGKSTLMNVLGCLDQPSSGNYELDGIETSDLSDNELADIRNRKIGFVFQSFNLLPRIPAVEQVELPLMYQKTTNRRKRALAALDAVGLSSRAGHKPSELSGGQQQRIAIARALVTEPAIILADEPTGNLDTRTSEDIMAIFQKFNRELGMTIIFVTHEPEIAQHTRRILTIRDGRIHSDEPVYNSIDAIEAKAALPREDDGPGPGVTVRAGLNRR